ncbi:MAG TPA: 1-deoxy-D-xylulose-5-phosphate reductoisomerase [Candidatus Syntrophosphaera sp.]|jgi:1-deoxy-D-xylulose-5-phosphate reductoisomerase|nr:1-deoxy-D-xylulose-5-phosphate reductoisomerase [Candidatus Syntrophosphaera sp.]HPH60355.1 1-deoxy-D-xylulose-5-phosphate reductoisomerase [Candidatus Syntrophosphaera sp.]
MVSKLALLGATGSIGSSTLAVLREQPSHITLSLVSAHRDAQKLAAICREFSVPTAILTGITDPAEQTSLQHKYPGLKLYFGEEELLKALRDEDYDVALNAISGSAGLRASFAIAEKKARLALANKESLVMAGHLLMPLIEANQVELLPVDSEHSAIFQAIGNHPAGEVSRIHITASGGSFRDLPLEDFTRVTPQQALKHPNWSMGAKVTLDSATMFNKALEVMEARWLFGLPYERISAVLHPQSVIHSLVEFVDGSILAQLSAPDMKLPILYALSWPQRWPSSLVPTDLLSLSRLDFAPIPPERFPLFYLGLEVAKSGGLLTTVLNSANEAALRLFLEEKITFPQIHHICSATVETWPNKPEPSLEEIIEANRAVYQGIIESHG